MLQKIQFFLIGQTDFDTVVSSLRKLSIASVSHLDFPSYSSLSLGSAPPTMDAFKFATNYLFDIEAFPTQTFLVQFYQSFTVDIIFPLGQDTGIACLFRFGTAATDFLSGFDANFLRAFAILIIVHW